MEVWSLGRQLRKELGIDNVWDSKELLILNKKGKPVLEMWYKNNTNDDFKYLYFEYINDMWIKVKESEVNV